MRALAFISFASGFTFAPVFAAAVVGIGGIAFALAFPARYFGWVLGISPNFGFSLGRGSYLSSIELPLSIRISHRRLRYLGT